MRLIKLSHGMLKVVESVGKVCEYICAALTMIMVLTVTMQVILRALNMPLFGLEEFLTFPTIWIYFLGGACASFTNVHIECGLIEAVSKSPKAIAVAKCVSDVLAVCIGTYVLSWAWQYAQYSLKLHKISAITKIPMSVGELIILVGLVLMAVFTLCNTIRDLAAAKAVFKGGEE